MKAARVVLRLVPAVVVLVAFSRGAVGQEPLLPTLPRLDALKLHAVETGVPVRHSASVSPDVARAIGKHVAACRELPGTAAPPPAVVLAMLDAADWKRVTNRPYGMPHHGTADSPYVVVVPQSWRDVAPMLAGVRTRLATALGEQGVDRYVHLIAMHEVGHLLSYASLGTNLAAMQTRFPFWYREFLANYFADGCLAAQPDARAFRRRGSEALLSIPRQRFTALHESDRLLTEVDAAGPYVVTEAGGLNFARYQGLTGVMAARLRDAGLETERLLGILRQQWARPGRQETDVLLKDFDGIAPGWRPWLGEQGAIAPAAAGRRRYSTSALEDAEPTSKAAAWHAIVARRQ